MDTVEIFYEALEQEILAKLGESAVMALATCAGGRVTARNMSFVFNGLKAAFQTSAASMKISQIRENPRVALCMGNIQIEGTAAILGHPYDIPWFREKYSRLHQGSFETYSWLDDECVVEVEPTLISLWKYSDGRPAIERLSVAEKKAFRDEVPLVGTRRDR